jgi:hypothetical protein
MLIISVTVGDTPHPPWVRPLKSRAGVAIAYGLGSARTVFLTSSASSSRLGPDGSGGRQPLA